MIASRFSNIVAPVARNAIQKRGISVVSGPPMVRVPFAEKFVLGTIMCTSLCVIPAWVLCHIKEYKGQK